MKKTFSIYSVFGHFILGKKTYKFMSYTNGVDHFSFCIAGVDTFPVKGDFSTGCIEIFIFQLSYLTSIHRIGPVCSKFLNIKLMCTTTNFFIRGKTNANSTMFNFWMLDKVFHCTYNFCNTRFIISTQQGSTICGNQGLTYIL